MEKKFNKYLPSIALLIQPNSTYSVIFYFEMQHRITIITTYEECRQVFILRSCFVREHKLTFFPI